MVAIQAAGVIPAVVALTFSQHVSSKILPSAADFPR
jgi:hypothetical protein